MGFLYLSGWHVLERHPATDQLTDNNTQTVDIWLYSIAMQVLLRTTPRGQERERYIKLSPKKNYSITAICIWSRIYDFEIMHQSLMMMF